MSISESPRSTFDQSVASSFVEASRKLEGLPGYLGIEFVEFQPGRLRAEMTVRPELLTPFGNMHGGVLAALCDHVLGCVCYPSMKRGQWAATTEFKINFLAPVVAGVVSAEAEIISMTRATAVVQISARNADRLVCAAQGTVLIRDPKEK